MYLGGLLSMRLLHYHLVVVIREDGKTHFCLGFVAWWFVHLQCQVIDPEFDPGHRSVLSLSWPELIKLSKTLLLSRCPNLSVKKIC